MAAVDQLTILEHSRVSPAAGVNGKTSQPLSFLDKYWIAYFPVHQLCFYEYPHSKSHFIQTTVPNLKHSLSLTLKHFFPYAGNLVVYSSSTAKKPEIRYDDGDSVSFTIAECTESGSAPVHSAGHIIEASASGFDYLCGNHARDADKFYPLVPQLGPVTKESGALKVPLLAVQVTLFPDHGICIGVTNNHACCDGNARVQFLKAWAWITKCGDDNSFITSGSLPFHDRSIAKEPGFLGVPFWDVKSEFEILESQGMPRLSGPSDKVRASFVLTQSQINKLKDSVLVQRPGLGHVSSFVVVCGNIWHSIAKLHAAAKIGNESCKDDDDVLEQITCPADLRTRLDPPLPATYFGNSVGPCYARAKRGQLVGEDGFLNAVELIREAIRKRFRSKESVLEDALRWNKEASGPPTTVGIAGSPKFNVYDTDFGWGKPKRCETNSTDYTGSVSLGATSRDTEEDLEIGISLPKVQMDAFATMFNNGLEITI